MSNNKKSNNNEVVVEPSATKESAEVKADKNTSTQKKNRNENSATQKKATGKSTTSGNNYLLLILLALVIAGISFYFFQLQIKQNQIIDQQARALNTLQSSVNNINQDIEEATKLDVTHSEQLVKLAEQIVESEAVSQKAIEIVNRSQREWALSEIDYLLRMAHRRVEVARDIAGAIAALKGADERIKELADLNLFKIRKQIAADISNLNAVHQADVNGISLAIDGMLVYLSELPFKSVKDEIKVQLSDETAEVVSENEEPTFVDSVLDTVKKIGDIKIHQRSIEAASSLEQQNQIEQLLRTYLLSSRLAALRFNQVQFLREVQQASEILRLHYEQTDNRVQQLQKTLVDFSALQLSPDLPELTKAWTLLQKEIVKSEEKDEVVKIEVENTTKEAAK